MATQRKSWKLFITAAHIRKADMEILLHIFPDYFPHFVQLFSDLRTQVGPCYNLA